MKTKLTRCLSLLVLVLPGLCWSAHRTAAAPAIARAKPAAHSTKATEGALPAEIPKSIFVISANPRESRNPFFPGLNVRPLTPPPDKNHGQGSKPAPADYSGLELNGLTPDGPKPTAMINGHTFEVGETHEIKLANGNKVLVKCEEIRADSVIISVGGQRRELKLPFGL